MAEMSIEKMLETRFDTLLEWVEPREASCPEGKDINANVNLRSTVHDCINMARAVARFRNEPTLGKDREFLLDFIAVHWATVYEA